MLFCTKGPLRIFHGPRNNCRKTTTGLCNNNVHVKGKLINITRASDKEYLFSCCINCTSYFTFEEVIFFQLCRAQKYLEPRLVITTENTNWQHVNTRFQRKKKLMEWVSNRQCRLVRLFLHNNYLQ